MSHKRRKKQKPKMQSEKPPTPPLKTRTWTLPTVLGLILGLVGALGVIELRPQITVSPMEPIEKSQPFSVPFRIQNIGYSSFWVEDAHCYVHEVKVGGMEFKDFLAYEKLMQNHYINRGDAASLRCYIVKHLKNTPIPNTADMSIVVSYRPWKTFPHTFTKSFRFVGSYIDNWQWTPQPSDFPN
jgi:hypothetical protein